MDSPTLHRSLSLDKVPAMSSTSALDSSPVLDSSPALDSSLASNRTPASHRSRVLLCAYACSPGRGSEESVGWDTAIQLAERGHDVVVLTRSKEAALSKLKVSTFERPLSIKFVTHDISPVLSFVFERLGKIGVDIGYFAWLTQARKVVTALHHRYQFTSSQHVTYARYWMPSPLSVLDIPFVWGPVGGGESVPDAFQTGFSLKGKIFELTRNAMRRMGERLASTMHNASTAHVALANTRETAARMKVLGARSIQIMNSAALSEVDQQKLIENVSKQTALTFISVGRLLEWKGFQLGLEAFSRANIPTAQFLVVGSGPYKNGLVSLVKTLGITNQVRFIEAVPRHELFALMASSHALVHPSMHESGGYVCLEMMAAGNPVICLDAGGPSLFVSETCGFLASVKNVDGAIDEMASFMAELAKNPNLGPRLGAVGQTRVTTQFSMSVKSDQLSSIHHEAVSAVEVHSTASSRSNFSGPLATEKEQRSEPSRDPSRQRLSSKPQLRAKNRSSL